MDSAWVWLISRGSFFKQPYLGCGMSGHFERSFPPNAALWHVGRKLDRFHQLNSRSKPKAVTSSVSTGTNSKTRAMRGIAPQFGSQVESNNVGRQKGSGADMEVAT